MNFVDSEFDLLSDRGGEVTAESAVERFISFELGGRLCCIAARAVCEVVHPMAVAPLPNSPEWLLGLSAYRGDPVAVIDPKVITVPSSDNRGKAKVIVFHLRPNETRLALPIESLHQMITAPAENRPPEYTHDGQPITFIDHEQLFESFDLRSAAVA